MSVATDISAAVSEAVRELEEEFQLAVESEGDGGAIVTVPGVDLGGSWAPQTVDLAFSVPFNYPFASIYPFFTTPALERRDGGERPSALQRVDWRGNRVTQIFATREPLGPERRHRLRRRDPSSSLVPEMRVNHELILDEDLHARLLDHLFQDDFDEHAAVVLAGQAHLPGKTRLLGRELILVPRDSFTPGRHGYRQIEPRFVAEVSSTAAETGLAYVSLHSHPGSASV